MMSGQGAVELLKFKTTKPEEFQSIVSQKLCPTERVEPMGKEFHADYRAYAVAQLIFTRAKYKHGISVLPPPGERFLFLELPLSGQLQLGYRGRDISFDQNSTYLIASNEPILPKSQFFSKPYLFITNQPHTFIGF